MRVSTIQQFNVALTRILDLQGNAAKFQSQLASGKRINAPSDDPVAASQLVRIDERVNNVDQFNRNADFATLRLNQQESAIAGVGDALQRVRELTIRGKTTSLSAEDRRFISQEVRQRAEEVFDLANSRNASGEFIFSGSKVNTQAFSRSASGSVNYQGDQTNRSLQISDFRKVEEGFTGHEVFMAVRNGNGHYSTTSNAGNTGTGRLVPAGLSDPSAFEAHDLRVVFTTATTFDVIDDTAGSTVLAGQSFVENAAINFNGLGISITGEPQAGDEFNIDASRNQSIFQTIENLATSLESVQATQADEAKFQVDLDRVLSDLDQSLNNLRETRAKIGARENSIESQKSANIDLSLQLQSAKSALEDVDIVEAVGNLARTTNALEAAQSAFVRVQSLSLFNFLR